MEMIYNLMHQGLSAIIPFVILLGFLIFVHELGHFLVAKWCGVRVEVFSLGFGKKIFQYKKGDTNYCISLVPLGGYVKMFGDEVGSQIDDAQKQFSFTHKNVWQRIAVVIAGPLMNFFFAILIYMIVSVLGEDFRSPVVGDVSSDSMAYQNGFRSGDIILTAAGKSIKTWDEFQTVLDQFQNEKVQIEVQRENSTQSYKLEATPKLAKNPNVLSLNEYIGEVEDLGYTSKSAMIGVIHNSVAYNLGLRTGDHLQTINGKEIKYFRELENYLIQFQGQPVSLEVERFNGKDFKPLKINGTLGSITSLQVFGVESSDLYLSKIVENSPAAEAGLKEGDKITLINEVTPKKWEDILNTVKSYNGSEPLKISIQRESEQKNLLMTPKLTSHMTHQGAEEKRYTIGIMPWIQMAPAPIVTIKSDSPIQALNRGLKKTWDMSVMTVVSFLRLATAKISPKNIGGIISIGQAASETFKMGINQFLQLMAVISVNLFILNLLPIPVLDGGHLLFYSIEALRGAPLSMRKMEIAQQVGLVLLMSLMALSLFNDFSRVLGFW